MRRRRCREQLNRLARLGAHYSALEAFVEAASAAAGEGASPLRPAPSLYRLALANGVSELLDVYRSAVLQVEAHLLHLPGAPPPLLTVQQFLLEFEVLLPEVATAVGEVQARSLVGSQIMGLLSLRAHSGVPAVQSCAQRLLWHCRQVLFKQLESWLVHGLLLDRAAEFFVQRSDGAAAAAAAAAAAGDGEEQRSLPGGQGGPSPSPLRLAGAPGGGAGAMLDWEPLEWHAGFQVRGWLLLMRSQAPGAAKLAAAAPGPCLEHTHTHSRLPACPPAFPCAPASRWRWLSCPPTSPCPPRRRCCSSARLCGCSSSP